MTPFIRVPRPCASFVARPPSPKAGPRLLHEYVMSNILPNLETFAKVTEQHSFITNSTSSNASVGCFCYRSWCLDSRCVSSNYRRQAHCSSCTGAGLLWYGQNYLIYPSAFPPGSRTGARSASWRTGAGSVVNSLLQTYLYPQTSDFRTKTLSCIRRTE